MITCYDHQMMVTIINQHCHLDIKVDFVCFPWIGCSFEQLLYALSMYTIQYILLLGWMCQISQVCLGGTVDSRNQKTFCKESYCRDHKKDEDEPDTNMKCFTVRRIWKRRESRGMRLCASFVSAEAASSSALSLILFPFSTLKHFPQASCDLKPSQLSSQNLSTSLPTTR